MGSIKEQNNVFIALANVMETWRYMIAQANVTDRDAPLLVDFMADDHKNTLLDPTYSVTHLILYIQ